MEGTITHSNLRCFLDTATPIVHTYIDAKAPFLPLLQNNDGDKIADGIKYFYLADLWNRFYEWSAYGVGTSVRLPSGEAIVQYFVPYLSAIQLYTNKSDAAASQSFGWHSNNNIIQGTSFDAYNKHAVEVSHMNKTGDEIQATTCKGELFFMYFELDSPYERMPFTDKMYELCCKFPDLLSLRSIDLSPSSWMSVFWYPLGHAPVRNKKDLSTCFLTYHSISTSEEYVTRTSRNASNCVTLAPFGLATHTMETEIWASPDSGDQEHVASLIDATQSWIKKRGIQHYDFTFFSHATPPR